MKIAKLVWILVAVALNLITLALYANNPEKADADVLLIYGMLVLSAPLGLFILLTFAIFLLQGAGSTLSWHQSTSIVWFILAASGYVQWFVVIPNIWRRVSPRFGKQR